MALTSETVRLQFSGDGATVAFAISYIFWDADDLQVVHTDTSGTDTTWTRGTQYTVTGGSGLTGTVTVEITPTDYTPANNETLTVTSNLDDIQGTSFPEGGPLPTASLEQRLDQIVRLIQQKAEQLGRSLVFPVSDSSALSSEIPNSTDRASARLGFDSSGNPVAVTSDITGVAATAFGTTVVEAANAAAGRTLMDSEQADADILKADTDDTLTAGFAGTDDDDGTKSSGTYTPVFTGGNFKKIVNGGAFTLAPPAETSSLVVQVTNNASAGTVTTSGFTLVDGDTIATTDADDFHFFITRVNSFSHLHVVALQ